MRVSFAELQHTGHGCNSVPYGISVVAACVKQAFTDDVDISIFKSTDSYGQYLENGTPDVACFSNYLWNFNLGYQFAKSIKKTSPETVIIFGGPNYTEDYGGQEIFLLNHPEIDFYIPGDGESTIVRLLMRIFSRGIDAKNGYKICGTHYIFDGNIVIGDASLPLALDDIPSPYLMGLCDGHLSDGLIPLVQTTRGCSFSCTFCQQGGKSFNSIRRFSHTRIKEEIEYIAQRTTSPDLMLADTNFGMYKEDIEVCRIVAAVQDKYGYPKYFHGIEGKNNKDRVIEAASIVKGAYLSAAVQSTNKLVLANVKRSNVSTDQMIQVGKYSEVLGLRSFSEVVLCLPGDTRDAHFRSIMELIDAGISTVRSHQLIMLPCAEISSKKSRNKYNMKTVFRVTPDTTSRYTVLGDTFIAPEIDEICVSNATMTFDDYLECRLFNLTVEIFYNSDVISVLIDILKQKNISISLFVLMIHDYITHVSTGLSDVYSDFLRETNEVWEDKEELKKFLIDESVIDRYIAGELGNNEQLFYRDAAIFNYIGDIQKISSDVANILFEGEFEGAWDDNV